MSRPVRRARTSDPPIAVDKKRSRKAIDATTGEVSSVEFVLPTDILCLVFAYVLEKPLVTVVAVVCKRWRDAVYRTIKYYQQGMSLALLPRLQHVTALDVTSRYDRNMTMLAGLSYLTTATVWSTHKGCCCHLLSGLRPLSTLRLRLEYNCPRDFASFVAHQRTSLTDLRVDGRLAFSLEGVHCPRLRSFHISGNTLGAITFIKQHASQLQSIVLAGRHDFQNTMDAFANVFFPALRKFKGFVFPLAPIPAFLATCPLLTDLRLLGNNYVGRGAPHPSLEHVLQGYEWAVTRTSEDEPSLAYIHRATQLRSLKVSLSLAHNSFPVPILSNVRKLVLSGDEHRKLEIRPSYCTSLQKLTLQGAPLEYAIVLPRLSVLVCEWGSFNGAFQTLHRIFSWAPNVRRCHIHLPKTQLKRMSLLRDFILRAVDRGFEELHLYAWEMATRVFDDLRSLEVPWMQLVVTRSGDVQPVRGEFD